MGKNGNVFHIMFLSFWFLKKGSLVSYLRCKLPSWSFKWWQQMFLAYKSVDVPTIKAMNT
jgi:hypothetical protein